MRPFGHLSALALAVVLTSCATSPPVSCPPGSWKLPQALLLRTDPAGASCSIFRAGIVVASVDVTPGTVDMPRRKQTIEVVCQKEGHLEHRMPFEAAFAFEVEQEQPGGCLIRQPSAGERAGGAVEQALLSLVPPVTVGIAAAAIITLAVMNDSTNSGRETDDPTYAFRQLPLFLLAPAVFASESSCDEYFAALHARLEAEVASRRRRVRESCHPWPCSASDPVCANPICEHQRARVDAELKSQLDQVTALRARVRIGTP